jgi:hypothetical protein
MVGEGRLMFTRKAWATLSLLVLLVSPAHAQDVDPIYRAAYCIGVIMAQTEHVQTPAYLEEQKKKAATLPSLGQTGQQLVAGFSQQLRTRHERYRAYVMLRTGGRPSEWIGALVAKGEKEEAAEIRAKAAEKLEDSQHLKCLLPLLSNSMAQDKLDEMALQCLARHDQGAANRRACLTMSDRLPF